MRSDFIHLYIRFVNGLRFVVVSLLCSECISRVCVIHGATNAIIAPFEKITFHSISSKKKTTLLRCWRWDYSITYYYKWIHVWHEGICYYYYWDGHFTELSVLLSLSLYSCIHACNRCAIYFPSTTKATFLDFSFIFSHFFGTDEHRLHLFMINGYWTEQINQKKRERKPHSHTVYSIKRTNRSFLFFCCEQVFFSHTK